MHYNKKLRTSKLYPEANLLQHFALTDKQWVSKIALCGAILLRVHFTLSTFCYWIFPWRSTRARSFSNLSTPLSTVQTLPSTETFLAPGHRHVARATGVRTPRTLRRPPFRSAPPNILRSA